MDLSLGEGQKMLMQSARDFLQKECPKSLVREMERDDRGYNLTLWQKMAALGWMGLILPERYGGMNGDFLDLTVLLEEMGRACLPSPFLATILGSMFILEAGSEGKKQSLLPQLASGKKILTLALYEPEFRYNPRAIAVKAAAEGDDYIIDGVKLFVPYAHIADYVICAARTAEETTAEEGVTLFVIDSNSLGITFKRMKTISRDNQSSVSFNRVKVPRKNILGKPHQGWSVVKKIWQKAAVAKCAELVGIAQQVLEMAVGYAKERSQFGRPIGSFQAIQHHCANMLIDVDGSRYMTYKAAWMISKGVPCEIEAAAAKGWTSEACRRVTAIGHQVFGGVGVITDHDMPLYYNRAKAAEVAFGDAEFYRELIVLEKLKSKRPKSWLTS